MTELIWDGKYKDGKKTSPVRLALPFQTIETVNESVQHDDRTIFDGASDNKWYNRLIWGDKKYVLPSLLPEFAGKVNLIYIDPPFDTRANFSFTASIPDNPDTEEDESSQFVKQPSLIEQKAYRDTWGKGIDSYAQWFYETVVLLRELLSEDGCIFIHLDWHIAHYAKIILDEVFGYDNFRNEISVSRIKKNVNEYERATTLNTDLDVIYFYAKSSSMKFTTPIIDQNREPRWHAFDAPNLRTGMDYEIFGKVPPKGRHWMWEKQRAEEAVKQGILRANPRSGNIEYLVTKKHEVRGSNWADITAYSFNYLYPTEKSEKLLDIVVNMATNEDDLVLDCFCGSGTTAAVAEKLNRKWITCDLGRFAIHTARKRLLGIPELKPFIVQNLGKYERQQWMEQEFDDPASKLNMERSYHRFILDLYHGEPLEGHSWVHGIKSGRFVHIGSVEAPITVEDIKSSIKEFWQLCHEEQNNASKGIDFLGWDFAFDVNQTAKEYAAANSVDIRFKKIPREVLEKKAVEQGDIRFYELAYLKVEHSLPKKGTVSLQLADLIVPTDDIPQEIQSKISHWSQWIDYWAVDWDYQEDTFHNQWQSYRTKQSPKLELKAENVYAEGGSYTIVIKVIDLLGNDTTKSISIEV